jgi:hypothetical protein
MSVNRAELDSAILPQTREYCEINGYSYEKLIGGCQAYGARDIIFGIPNGHDGARGLVDDMASMPYPMLLVELQNDGTCVFHETEHTKRLIT